MGSSMVVRQFVAVAFGEMPVHSPMAPWKVVRVVAEERYCLGCFGVRAHDVVVGDDRSAIFCRCCGKETAG